MRGASASARISGENDLIVAGFIGTGRMGESNLRDFIKQSNVEVAAVCDVYAPNLEKAGALAPRAVKLTDFRRLLDRKAIDVVVVATPDHWHALTMIMACQAGKDVYVEKPISLTIGLELIPEKRRESPNKMVYRAEPVKIENSNDQHETHVRNFLDSVKSRQKPICDIEIGHRTTSAALLANIAYRSRRRIVWDGKNEEIIGDREAARFLARPCRKPWSLKV